MDSPPSSLASIVDSLREAAHQGDWARAVRMLRSISETPLPTDPTQLGAHLANLGEALIAARASRSHLTLKRNRVRAAAGFINGRNLPSGRHDFVESPGS